MNGYSVWTLISSDIFVALTVGFILGLLGTTIGLSFSSHDRGVVYSLGIGGVIWLFFSIIAVV